MKKIPIVAAIFFLFAVGAMAETTNDLSDAEIQGRNLAQQLLEQIPATNSIQTGVLKIRDAKNNQVNVPLKWITGGDVPDQKVCLYEANWTNRTERLFIFRTRNVYFYGANSNSVMTFDDFPVVGNRSHQLSGAEIMMPFAHSDFWIADLGLEFFHWPEQKILKHEMKRGRSCQVLESTNPNPSTNGYSRVVSWIDNETLGIVHAEAYDFKNKLLKEFDPKSFKKVNGRWELQEMEIRNIQTGSRTRLEFDVKKE
jgi:hypothetical protein